MANSYKDIEIRISKALEAYHRDPNQKIAPLARKFDVPYQRLQQRVKGRPSRIGNSNAIKALTEAQEAALVKIIDQLNHLNINLTAGDIEDYANLLLRRHFEACYKPPDAPIYYIGNRPVSPPPPPPAPIVVREPSCPEIQGLNHLSDDARGIVPQRRHTPSPAPSSSSIENPRTPISLQRSFRKLKRHLRESDSPDILKLRRRVERIEKFTVLEYEYAALRDSVIESFHEARKTRLVKKSRKQLSKTYVLSTGDALRRINQRTEKENEIEIKQQRAANLATWQDTPTAPGKENIRPEIGRDIDNAPDSEIFGWDNTPGGAW